MKFKVFALTLYLLAVAAQIHAHSSRGYPVSRQNEVRLLYSDGLTLSTASFWGMGIGDALSGTLRQQQRSAGVFGLGYRHWFSRFRVGLDLGFATVTSKRDHAGSRQMDIREKQLNLIVMPVAELTYYRRGCMELYGSAAVGADFTSTREEGLTSAGRAAAAARAHLGTEFAFQVNPIAIRVGNEQIGGFLEAGIGTMGFLTAGASMKF